MWKKWIPHILLMTMYNGADTLENNLAVTEKVKHRYDSAIALGIFS